MSVPASPRPPDRHSGIFAVLADRLLDLRLYRGVNVESSGLEHVVRGGWRHVWRIRLVERAPQHTVRWNEVPPVIWETEVEAGFDWEAAGMAVMRLRERYAALSARGRRAEPHRKTRIRAEAPLDPDGRARSRARCAWKPGAIRGPAGAFIRPVRRSTRA